MVISALTIILVSGSVLVASVLAGSSAGHFMRKALVMDVRFRSASRAATIAATYFFGLIGVSLVSAFFLISSATSWLAVLGAIALVVVEFIVNFLAFVITKG